MAIEKNVKGTGILDNSGAVAKKDKLAVTKPSPKKENKKNSKMPKFIAAFVKYIKEIAYEISKVIFPTLPEVGKYTLIVVIFCVILMLVITGLDFLFGFGAGFAFDAG